MNTLYTCECNCKCWGDCYQEDFAQDEICAECECHGTGTLEEDNEQAEIDRMAWENGQVY